MSNTQYIFLPAEQSRLIDPENLPWPDESVVLFAFENNDIIGRIGAIPQLHIEGVWIREDKRNSSVLSNLVSKLEDELKAQNRSIAFVYVLDDNKEMADYVARLGYSEMPIKIYAKALVNS
jgi:N-acetylglutamate synthase-like GNAT family acetyltransferase